MQVTAPSHAAHEAKEAAIERLQPFYFKMLKWGSLKAVGLKWRTENWHKNVKALKKEETIGRKNCQNTAQMV